MVVRIKCSDDRTRRAHMTGASEMVRVAVRQLADRGVNVRTGGGVLRKCKRVQRRKNWSESRRMSLTSRREVIGCA